MGDAAYLGSRMGDAALPWISRWKCGLSLDLGSRMGNAAYLGSRMGDSALPWISR